MENLNILQQKSTPLKIDVLLSIVQIN